jgi:NAD(P)-dependent dehydrogenase (short-subunit alcohol dehydrogenase family)
LSPQFAGRTAIVTGAARGIGRAIAEALAAQGAAVVVADIDSAGSETAAAEIGATGAQAAGFAVDVADEEGVDRLVSFACSLHGGVDILVNNAATTSATVIEETAPASWRNVMDVNLTGPFLCSRAVLPHMRARRRGKIVNIASVAAKRISFNSGASYTASKAGLLAFTRHLAYEAAPDGINVNAVCPGPVLTTMSESVTAASVLAERRSSIPAGRLPTAADQAAAVVYLASSAADMVFGQAIDVDGGALLGWYDTATYFDRRGAHRPAAPTMRGTR